MYNVSNTQFTPPTRQNSVVKCALTVWIRHKTPGPLTPQTGTPAIDQSAPVESTYQTDWRNFFQQTFFSPELPLKGLGSPYSITERTVPELIPVLGSQHARDVSHKPGGRLPLLSARPAVTHATLKRSATSLAAWWTEAQWVWAVCLRLLPNCVEAAIWTRAFLRPSPAR